MTKQTKIKVSPEEKERLRAMAVANAQSVVENLKKAYEHRPPDLSYEEEEKLIDALTRAKKLEEEVKKAFDQADEKDK